MRLAPCLVILAACHHASGTAPAGPQSFADGVQAMCDLPDHVPDNGQRYDARLAAAATWADQHVTNPDARKVGDLKSLAANKQAFAAAVQKAGVTHCKLLDNGMELQSFADAMKVLCTAPADAKPDYFASHLLNTEVVRLLATGSELQPQDFAARVKSAAGRAGLTQCSMLDRLAARPAGNMPVVPDIGLAAVPEGPTVIATETAVIADGKPVVTLDHGVFPAQELDGGATGIAVPRLQKFLAALATQVQTEGYPHPPAGSVTFTQGQRPLPPLVLVLDPATKYRTLFSIMYSAMRAGWQQFALAVDGNKAIPLTLPSRAAPGTTPPAGLRMVASLTTSKLILWSLSGLEGSLQKPALSVAPDRVADVQKSLAAIAARRHPGAGERQIIVMADGALAVQQVAAVMAAVRVDAAGQPLFPDILLSSGFD